MKYKIIIFFLCIFSTNLAGIEISDKCWIDLSNNQLFIFQNDSLEVKILGSNLSRKASYKINEDNIYLLNNGLPFDSLRIEYLSEGSMKLFYIRDNIGLDFHSYSQKDIHRFTKKFNHYNFSVILESEKEKKLLFKLIEYDSALVNFIGGSWNCVTNHAKKITSECYGTILRIDFESEFKNDSIIVLIDSIGENYITGVDYNSKEYVKLLIIQEDSLPIISQENYVFDSLDIINFTGNYLFKIEEYSENNNYQKNNKDKETLNDSLIQTDYVIFIGYSYFTFLKDGTFVGEIKGKGPDSGPLTGLWNLLTLRNETILNLNFEENDSAYFKLEEITKNEFWFYPFYITNCFEEVSRNFFEDGAECAKLIKTN